jgi:hypothetical protein
MINDRLLLIVCLGASVLAFTLLIIMMILPWPFDFAFPGVGVLGGSIVLTEAEFSKYLEVMQLNYAVDEVFIVCWIIGWSTLSLQISRSLKVTPVLLILGLLGPVLDLTENSHVWQMISLIESGQVVNPELLASWGAIQHLSYIIPFSVSLLLLCLFFTQGTIKTGLLMASIVITLIAIFGLYLPALEVASYVWWLFFFLVAAHIAWKRLQDTGSNPG